MPKTPDTDQYSDKEATQRMNDALRRALTTPQKPNKDIAGKRRKSPKAKAKK